jgi:hypothetical protein
VQNREIEKRRLAGFDRRITDMPEDFFEIVIVRDAENRWDEKLPDQQQQDRARKRKVPAIP